MKYIDAFVIPIAKKNVPAYLRMAKKAGKIWQEYGAMEYRECVGNDLKATFGLPFPRLAKLKANETVFFSWIVYKSKAQRDRVNAKVMKDPRIAEMCDPTKISFNAKRMTYGGFKVVVDLASKKKKK